MPQAPVFPVLTRGLSEAYNKAWYKGNIVNFCL